MNRKNDLKVYYVDEEKDEIFVDSDDEYKEVLKVAAERNKVKISFIEDQKQGKQLVYIRQKNIDCQPNF